MCMLHHLPSSAALLPGISDLDLEEEGLPTTDEIVEHYCKVRDRTWVWTGRHFLSFLWSVDP